LKCQASKLFLSTRSNAAKKYKGKARFDIDPRRDSNGPSKSTEDNTSYN